MSVPWLPRRVLPHQHKTRPLLRLAGVLVTHLLLCLFKGDDRIHGAGEVAVEGVIFLLLVNDRIWFLMNRKHPAVHQH